MSSNLKVNTILPSTGTAIGIGTASGNVDVLGHIVGHNTPNISGINSVTASHFYGNGANLTGIDVTQIVTGNTSVQTVDTGSDGHIKLTTEGTERLRITNDGKYYFTGTGGGSGSRGLEIDTEAVGAQDEGVIFNARASGTTGKIKFQTNSATAMTILGNGGNIGINQTSPQRRLHIGESGTAEANLRIQGGADYAELRVKDSDNELSIHTNIAGAGSREAFSISGITGHVNINAVSYQALTITTSENGTNGPEVQLMHNSTTPAVGDVIGQLRFSGKDTAGNTTLFSKIETKIDDPSNGTEGGHLEFSTRGGGAYNSIFRLKARSSASAPNYTTDDMNGIILDTYNTGNPYPRYFNFIAKSAGNTDSNIGFWTEAVGGSPTEKMRISADGYVLKPSMPSFFVHGSPSMGTNTGYQNIAYSFSSVKHNTGSHYANNTGRFTAPVAGVYFFCGGLWANMSDNNSGSYLMVFKKNGSEAGVGCNHRTYQNQLSASMVISLSANDIITLGYADGSGGTVQASTPRSYFCGYLIG